MSRWYVKDLSKLTKVSVRALHHYDQIGLLKPSLRASNGYRVYSDKDLSKLQQIVALKFYGFGLEQIKTLLGKINSSAHEQLSEQAKFLEEKAKILSNASQTLKNIIAGCTHDQSVNCNWENILKLFGVYNMINELEKTPMGKALAEILNPEQLKELAAREAISAETSTNRMLEEAKELLISEDPTGPVAQAFVVKWTLLMNEEVQHLDKDTRKTMANAQIDRKIQKHMPTSISPEVQKVSEWMGKAFAHAYTQPTHPKIAAQIKEQLQNISKEELRQYFAKLQPAFDELQLCKNKDPYAPESQAALEKWFSAGRSETLTAILLQAQEAGVYKAPKKAGWLCYSHPHHQDETRWMQKAIHFRFTGNKI